MKCRQRQRQLREMWEQKAWSEKPLGPGWNDAFANWIRKYGHSRVADAVQMASRPRFSEDGARLPVDILNVPKFAAVERAEDREPGMKTCHLVRGRMRSKFFCHEDDNEILKLLQRLKRAGVSASTMHEAVDTTETLEDCFAMMGLDRTEFRIAMGHPIDDRLPVKMVFVSTESREWALWDADRRKKTGKGLPNSNRGGWYVPSRLPPTDEPKPTKKPKKQ